MASEQASKKCTLTQSSVYKLDTLIYLPLFLPSFSYWASKAKKSEGWLKLTALTLKSLIYNICDLFDERLQQQTIAAAQQQQQQ